MSNEEKFRNKVSELLNEPYFPYDAENWEVASQYLDEQDKKKRRRFFWIFFSGLGLVTLFTAHFFMSQAGELKPVAEKNSSVEKQLQQEKTEQPGTTNAALPAMIAAPTTPAQKTKRSAGVTSSKTQHQQSTATALPQEI